MNKEYSVQQESLTIRVIYDENSKILKLLWTGKSIDRNPSNFLTPLFEQWTLEAEKNEYTFSMDFSKLEYMNSSSIIPIILVIQDLKKRSIKQIIRFNGLIKWQQLSFSALRVFSGNNSQLELIESGEDY